MLRHVSTLAVGHLQGPRKDVPAFKTLCNKLMWNFMNTI